MAAALVGLALLQGFQAYQNQRAEEAGLREQEGYRQQISALNNRLSVVYQEEAIRSGDEDVQKIQKAKTEILGAQRVSLASQGVDINSGTSAQLLAETEKNAALDIITAKNNAWRKAWGYKVEAASSNLEGKMMARATENQIRNSLLTRDFELAGSVLKAYSYADKSKQKIGGTETSSKGKSSGSVSSTSSSLPFPLSFEKAPKGGHFNNYNNPK